MAELSILGAVQLVPLLSSARPTFASPIVGVVAKPGHPRAAELLGKLIPFLKTHQCAIKIESETAGLLNLAQVEEDALLSRDLLSATCDVIVVLGGDGTLISVCRHSTTNHPIILGVNLGTLGFLTEITPEEMLDTLADVLANRAMVESRHLLSCEVYRHLPQHNFRRELIASYSAINDVVVTKQALARIFAVELSVDQQFAAVIRGDGIIVSTPAGSTAYSMAAGGSIVHPQVQALLVTPICSHSLTSRPLVLPSAATIQLNVAKDTGVNEVYLTIDGQSGMALLAGDEVLVRTSSRYVQFARSQRTYYEILASKLKWAGRT